MGLEGEAHDAPELSPCHGPTWLYLCDLMKKTGQLLQTGGAGELDQPSAEALPLTALDTSWPGKPEAYDKHLEIQGKKCQSSDLFSMSLG